MRRGDWLKVMVCILLSINTWLIVIFYLHHKRERLRQELLLRQLMDQTVVTKFMQKSYGLQVGQSFRVSIPHTFIGSPPPLGQGYPVCFLHIGASFDEKVWESAITEALGVSPNLYVVLICHPPPYEMQWDWRPVRQFIQNVGNPRLSALVGNWQLFNIWGQPNTGGILLVLCDGNGIIRAVEPYPNLKISPNWEEEVKDWQSKLHQVVKKVLDKFFREGKSH